jgi:hypothetical protein
MATTVRPDRPAQNHTFPDSVAIERMSDEIVSLAIGARKQRSAPKDHGVHQLRRDVLRGRNKCYLTALKLAFADLQDGESIDDVTAPLYATIHMLETYSGADVELAFEAYIKIENELKAEETRLEIEYLCGDKSTSLTQKLDLLYGRHARVIDKGRRALGRSRYSGRTAAA